MYMAITKSAKKEIKSSANKRVFNIRRSRQMKSDIKEFRELAKGGDKKQLKEKMSEVQKSIDKAAKRGIIKKNTAARKKSRLAKFAKSFNKTE